MREKYQDTTPYDDNILILTTSCSGNTLPYQKYSYTPIIPNNTNCINRTYFGVNSNKSVTV